MLGVLDTSVVISGLDAAEVAGIPAERRPKGFAVSAVTLAELHFGVLVAPDGAERTRRIKRLLDVQRTLTVLRVEEDVAASYGLIAAATSALNRSPRRRVMGLLIAASAHAYGATVLTRNPDDFRTYGDLVDVVALPRATPPQRADSSNSATRNASSSD